MSSHCFVPGCNTGYGNLKAWNKKHGLKNSSLFRPRTSEMIQKWEQAIKRDDKSLTLKDSVCELHFLESDIERFYTQKLTDGTIFQLKRGVPKLKENAVPSVFPNYPKYMSQPKTKRKMPMQRDFVTPQKNKIPTKAEVVHDVHTINDSEQMTTMFDNVYTGDIQSTSTAFIQTNTFTKEDMNRIVLPSKYWISNIREGNILLTCWDRNWSLVKWVVVQPDLTVNVFLCERKIQIEGMDKLNDISSIPHLLKNIEHYTLCSGVDKQGSSEICSKYIYRRPNGRGPQIKTCLPCKKYALRLKRQERRETYRNEILKKNRLWRSSITKKNKRLQLKVQKLKNEVKNLMQKCSESKEGAVQEVLSNLPEPQQEAVRSCLNASKVKNLRSIRYTTQWVYECLLLRIKSKKTYEHLRTHKILAVPCVQTLSRYIKKVQSIYGFQANIFHVLAKKAVAMQSTQRRGVLLVDEMKLSSGVSFNTKKLQVMGFVNLGKYTPKHQVNERGDHALVLMFQPFRGKWVQSLACFLSKGCASGTILHLIVMEAIILLERSGFYVDAVVTDGATWNRTMWNKFGVSEESISCPHISDPSRRLWFISDFPHLIKNLRNFITKHDETSTPDGILKLKHFYGLIEIESGSFYNLKANFKITQNHIKPQYFQKMNVALAFQLFTGASAMQLYQNIHPDLQDSKPTQTFCKRVENLIEAMNSRTPCKSIMPENKHYQTIEDFLQYLIEWERHATVNGYHFLPPSTFYGLKIFLKATLELCDYLSEKCDFKYIMTARLNQDALERFFGLMRNTCGSNDHPDPTLFIQMYGLVSTYSLCKPPRGSNISGGETLNVLLSLKDISDAPERKLEWEKQLDNMLDRWENLQMTDATIVLDHQYCKEEMYDYIVSYMAGYVARKAQRFVTVTDGNKSVPCDKCMDSLQLPPDCSAPERDKLIDIKSKGNLIHPSQQLFNLILLLEKSIISTLSLQDLNSDSLFDIMSTINNLYSSHLAIPILGCEHHTKSITKKIMCFYLITRMHFLCKDYNRRSGKEKMQTKEKRKAAKLI